MQDLKNRVALVTGASRGIGKAVAMQLARQGAHVALMARNEKALTEVAHACKQAGVKVVTLARDLSQPASLADVVDEVRGALGSLDVLVNNAGIYEHGAVDTADLAAWDTLMAVNVAALVHLTRHALGDICKSRHGAVINIASVSGKQSHAGGAIYCASKHAVVGFTHALFEDIRERGVKVCAICPGFVNTDMVADSGIVAERAIQPDDIAEAVLYVLRGAATACPTEIVIRPQHSPYKKR